MAGEAGIDFLLKVEVSTTPTTIGGLRSKSMTINAEAIDITNHGSQEWRQILDGKGVRSMSTSGSGVFTDSAAEAEVRTLMLANTLMEMSLVDADTGDMFSGSFKCTSLEYAGEHNGERTYSMSFESAGVVTFTAA